MRVKVEIEIAPHPPKRVHKALRTAGKRLASAMDSVQPLQKRVAVLMIASTRIDSVNQETGVPIQLPGEMGVKVKNQRCHVPARSRVCSYMVQRSQSLPNARTK